VQRGKERQFRIEIRAFKYQNPWYRRVSVVSETAKTKSRSIKEREPLWTVESGGHGCPIARGAAKSPEVLLKILSVESRNPNGIRPA
jgi:hypothetical protein